MKKIYEKIIKFLFNNLIKEEIFSWDIDYFNALCNYYCEDNIDE